LGTHAVELSTTKATSKPPKPVGTTHHQQPNRERDDADRKADESEMLSVSREAERVNPSAAQKQRHESEKPDEPKQNSEKELLHTCEAA
jgi:hypothetical protein